MQTIDTLTWMQICHRLTSSMTQLLRGCQGIQYQGRHGKQGQGASAGAPQLLPARVVDHAFNHDA